MPLKKNLVRIICLLAFFTIMSLPAVTGNVSQIDNDEEAFANPCSVENLNPHTDNLDYLNLDVDDVDGKTRINQLQYLGTHNSYYIQPENALLNRLRLISPAIAREFEYTHEPLDVQFDDQQIRQVELDIFVDREGGRYAHRAGKLLLTRNPYTGIPELEEPGYKLMHIPHIDYRTHYLTFIEGLEAIKDWSQDNPGHLPIFVLVELKGDLSDELEELPLPLQFIINAGRFVADLVGVPVNLPPPTEPRDMDDLDEEILSVFHEDQIIIPDDVRGEYETLNKALQEKGWPTIEEARGKVMFLLDNECRIRDLYLEDNPTLEGRILFTSSKPDKPSAGFIKLNDPRDNNKEKIREYVEKGYLIRTRADGGEERREREIGAERRNAAFQSGAHFISTDFPEPSDWGYIARLPGAEDKPARCNPVSPPPGCDPENPPSGCNPAR